jgi:aerobic carbon-monoxide dehydrogenase medium subunit
MSPLPPFTVLRPASLAEACAVLADDPDATAYAGGTELVVAMKLGLAAHSVLVDLKSLAELSGIALDGPTLRIGAATTHREVVASPAAAAGCPLLVEALRDVANPRVRAVGTIGGNLAFGEPHSDPATALVAADARVRCHAPGGVVRSVAAADFLVGPFETCLEPGELISAVEVPRHDRARSATGYRRLVLTERAAAIAAVRLDIEGGGVEGGGVEGGRIVDARVVVGAATPRPTRVTAAERLLVGRAAALDDAVRAEAGRLAADTSGVDARDAEAAEDYLRHLVSVLVEDALGDAAADALRLRPRPSAAAPAARRPPPARRRWPWRRP